MSARLLLEHSAAASVCVLVICAGVLFLWRVFSEIGSDD